VISGQADSDYAKDLETRRSVSEIITFLCGAVITLRSKMMPMVALSVTQAELFAAVMTVQDMLFIMRIVESMGLQVEKPMLLEIDNKGAKDLINNWSVGGRLRHIEVSVVVATLDDSKDHKYGNYRWSFQILEGPNQMF
jgi:hypothetical protein